LVKSIPKNASVDPNTDLIESIPWTREVKVFANYFWAILFSLSKLCSVIIYEIYSWGKKVSFRSYGGVLEGSSHSEPVFPSDFPNF
jgi:hypothetical protein